MEKRERDLCVFRVHSVKIFVSPETSPLIKLFFGTCHI